MILDIKPARSSQIPEIMETAASGIFTKDFLQDAMENALLTEVIICDKIVKGVCICRASRIPDSCEVAAIYISEKFRRIGFGRKLLSYSLREMRAMRFKNVYVWIDEQNNSAVSFFKKIGFNPDGKRRDSSKNGREMRFRIDI